MRFVLISFALLGWAFYVLSGGSDFDANAVREARMADLDLDAPKPAAPAPAPAVVIQEAPKVVVDTDPPLKTDSAGVAVSLTAPAPANAAVAPDAGNDVPRNVAIVTSSADTPAIIPSLIDPTDGVTETVEEPAQVTGLNDIRTVSGNRVNVRGGPGTNFGIVGRLGRGDEILVLEDNGIGWIRFETTNGATAGWMADFLLSSS